MGFLSCMGPNPMKPSCNLWLELLFTFLCCMITLYLICGTFTVTAVTCPTIKCKGSKFCLKICRICDFWVSNYHVGIHAFLTLFTKDHGFFFVFRTTRTRYSLCSSNTWGRGFSCISLPREHFNEVKYVTSHFTMHFTLI